MCAPTESCHMSVQMCVTRMVVCREWCKQHCIKACSESEQHSSTMQCPLSISVWHNTYTHSMYHHTVLKLDRVNFQPICSGLQAAVIIL